MEKHFDAVYHSVVDDGAKDAFLQRIAQVANKHGTYIINVHDIAEHCSKQKKGEAIGLDDIPMEAYMFGGTRLHIHLAILFNCFIKFGHVPKPFMQCMIIPLIKNT